MHSAANHVRSVGNLDLTSSRTSSKLNAATAVESDVTTSTLPMARPVTPYHRTSDRLVEPPKTRSFNRESTEAAESQFQTSAQTIRMAPAYHQRPP